MTPKPPLTVLIVEDGDEYLDWVPDAVTAEQIRAKMAALAERRSWPGVR